MTTMPQPAFRLRLSTFLLALGIMLTCSGVAYGIVPVSAGVACGNAFTSGDGNLRTAAGDEACAQARSERQAHTWGLIVPGLVGVVAALVAMSRENETQQENDPTPTELVQP